MEVCQDGDLVGNPDDSNNNSSDEDFIDPGADPEGSKFLKLAEEGDNDAMKGLLVERPDLLNFRDSDQYTPLHRASYAERPETVKFLLKEGAELSARTLDGWTPLHSACRWNSHKCVTILLQNGAEINAKTEGGLTPLHVAAENAIARETLIVLLLNPGLDINIVNASGETADVTAGQHGSFTYLFEMVRKSVVNL